MPRPFAFPAPAPLGAERPTGTEIAGLGVALPETVVANAPIAARLGIEEDWIVRRMGIHERRIAAPGDTLAGYAAQAGRRALAGAGVAAADLDLILVATISNDELTPAAAPRVAAELGADAAAAIDVNAACTGFVSALSLACAQIESGRAGTVLVIGADLMSRLVDREDRKTAPLFGDGAGAVVVRGAARGRIGPVVLGADGANADLIYARREEGLLRMQGHETFRHAVDRMSEVSLLATAAAGLQLSEIDLFVYHQANARILQAIGARLVLAPELIVNCIGRYGNVSAATIPLALEAARQAGTLRNGARVLLAAFGAGLTWGATVVEWGSEADAA
jgi:3-oxoacyl-[acyl-carrier-protein] synthase III